MSQPVVILHDVLLGRDALEDEDTLQQAQATRTVLEAMGCNVTLLPFTLDLRGVAAALRTLNPLLVFSFVDTVEGRDELIHLAPMLLAHLNIPYTGCPMRAVFNTMHKPHAKRLLRDAGLPTAHWIEEAGISSRSVLEGPYILKSADRSASHGLDADSVAGDAATLKKVYADRKARCGGEWFAEAYIEGREFTLPMLAGPGGPTLLAMVEIDFGEAFKGRPRIIDYAAKWLDQSPEYLSTPYHFLRPGEDAALQQQLTRIAFSCWELFGLAGYGRIDIRVDAQGRPFVLEVNTNPYLCPQDLFANAAEQQGYSFEDTVLALARDALQRAGRPIPEVFHADADTAHPVLA